MDAEHFDRLSRALSAHAARRTVLAGLSSTPLALLHLALVGEDAAAKKRKRRRRKKKKKASPAACIPACAGKVCGDDGCGGSCGTCGGAKSCLNGLCVCPNGLGDSPACTATEVCQATTANSKICFPGSTCPANAAACTGGGVGTDCGAGCKCGVSQEGLTLCVGNVGGFCAAPPPTCTSSAACPAGEACIEVGGCCSPLLPAGTRYCFPPCTFPDA